MPHPVMQSLVPNRNTTLNGHPLANPLQIGLKYTEHYITTKDNVKLHAWFIPSANTNAAYTVLYMHSNAGNIGHSNAIYHYLFKLLGCSIFTFDYRGYGMSTGTPSVEGFWRDCDAVIEYMKTIKEID